MSNKESVTVYINLELSEQGKRLLDALRPKGEWIDDPKNNAIKYCSNCELGYTKDFLLGMLPYYNPNPQMVEPPYCPNCGAKMKGADDE